MENEDRKTFKENVTSMPRDNSKEIEIHGGAGEIGINIFKVTQWKTKCESYFNRYYKTSNIIVGPSDRDIIMNTLSFVCSDSKGRGFVFKNYDIAKHLEFLGYAKMTLEVNLGAALTNKKISYIAYIEQKNVIIICEKVSRDANVHQCLKNITVMIKYFLTLYDKEIRASGVKVIGLLIREKEKQQLVECSFCHLFSPSYKDFESPTSFNDWWDVLETYERWWDLTNPKIQNKLFDDLAAQILCFMAVQEKGLPTLTDNISQQFKQTYFLYTPQQMDIHFSNDKHIIIQGSYGSGKSLVGLKKLELISKSLGKDEKIIYINFDFKSNLHVLMEENVKRYVAISSRKIKRISNVRDILESSDKLIYVCHNSARENLSGILEETVNLNISALEVAKINFHLIIEEYDGETLSHDEAGKITKLIKGSVLMKSNIILLAQPLIKNRSWNIGKKTYERETCMFRDLENIFRTVKLEEVLRCSNKICEITKYTQNFVRNKDSVFKTEMNKLTLEQLQQDEGNKKHFVSPSVLESYYPDVGTSRNKVFKPNNDFRKSSKSLDLTMELDQAFERSAPLQKSKSARSKIVSKFVFFCEPKQGVDIEGLKPNLIEFSEDINLSSDIAIISLALVLKYFIGKNETTTVLHMADDQPMILRRTIQLLSKLLDKTFSYTQDIEAYFQKKKQSKIVFSSNFRNVNGMEFDHVAVMVSQSEYYLKYYLPQVISRCTYDLNFVLLPQDKKHIEKSSVHNLFNFIPKNRNSKTNETIANIIEELRREYLVKQVLIAECKACEKNYYCYSISNETDSKQAFGVHTHSDQYNDYLAHLIDYRKLEEQAQRASASAVAETK